MDEIVAVSMLLFGQSLCLDCIVVKSDLPRDGVVATLILIERAVFVAYRPSGFCDVCGKQDMTYSIPMQ